MLRGRVRPLRPYGAEYVASGPYGAEYVASGMPPRRVRRGGARGRYRVPSRSAPVPGGPSAASAAGVRRYAPLPGSRGGARLRPLTRAALFVRYGAARVVPRPTAPYLGYSGDANGPLFRFPLGFFCLFFCDSAVPHIINARDRPVIVAFAPCLALAACPSFSLASPVFALSQLSLAPVSVPSLPCASRVGFAGAGSSLRALVPLPKGASRVCFAVPCLPVPCPTPVQVPLARIARA